MPAPILSSSSMAARWTSISAMRSWLCSAHPSPMATTLCGQSARHSKSKTSVTELSDPSGEALASHVGIAAGEVVAGGVGRGYSVFGGAVNLAARLVELARPGEIVISAPLARLLEGKIRAMALPPATLKGIDAPVTGWRVEGLAAGRRRRFRLSAARATC